MYKRNLGDQIHDAVEDAIHSMDYGNLNKKIRETADRAIYEFNRATGKRMDDGQYDNQNGYNDYNQQNYSNNDDTVNWQYGSDSQYKQGYQGSSNYQQNQRRERYAQKRREYEQKWEQKKQQYGRNYAQKQAEWKERHSNNKIKIKGTIPAVITTLVGVLGVTGFGIAAFVLLIIFMATGFCNFVLQTLICTFGVVMVPFVALTAIGTKKRHMISRCRTYHKFLEDHQCCEIKKIAESTNRSEKYVVRDIQKMIGRGMFEQGHLDKEKKYLILSDTAFEQFSEAQKSYEERCAKEEQEKQEMQGNEELAQAIAAGKEYIEAIRKANDDIPGEEISGKLDRLEDVIRKIFICVKKHPEKLPEIRKFMDYYLPITLKLINAYRDFDQQSIQGDTIKSSKEEIENTLDTIIVAFEKLFDSLYDNEAMDISSDISVLNTLFAQDGLAKDDFKREDK